MHVAHLTLHDFRSYADVDVPLEPGVDRVHRPQRAGQDQPGRGDRLPLPARPRTGSRATRRWSAPAPSRRSCGRRWCATGGTAVLEVELNPGRSNRARINRSPLPRARELLGLVRTVVFSPEDLDPGQGRPVGPAPVPRRPAGAAGAAAGRRPRRLRPGAQAAQLAAQDRRRCPPRVGLAGVGARRRSAVWDAHLARTGGELLAERLRLVDALRPYVGKAYETVARGRQPRRRRDRLPAVVRRSAGDPGRAPTGR